MITSNINWEAVAAIAESLGALGVIASLIFVGLQVRADAKARRAQTVHQQAEAHSRILADVANNGELAEILARDSRDPSLLDEVEQIRFINILGNLFRVYENSFLQHKLGQLDAAVWRGISVALDQTISLPGIADWWRRSPPGMFTPEFQSFIESKDSIPPSRLPVRNLLEIEK